MFYGVIRNISCQLFFYSEIFSKFLFMVIVNKCFTITMRNVEIKAKVVNIYDLIKKAKILSGNSNPEIIKQNDVFYKVSEGRFKLRKFENGSGELIYYQRPDGEGPKLCAYEKTNVNSENLIGLNSVLCAALGKKCAVNKIRKLFIVGQTRVHVDTVEGLGDFMELEVVLEGSQSLEDGQLIAFDLMDKLGISKSDLISTSYADLLSK